jgi:hypothetical protein
MKYIHWMISFLATLLTAAILCAAESPGPANMPALNESLRFSAPLDFCGETVPVEIADVRERLEKEMLLTLYDRPQIILWIKRANRFFPIIETMLAESGLPDDLKYISVIESALRPHVGSPKGAIGFWQFMQGTGQLYGLTINAYVDERRNIFKSTRAAIAYFKQLYEDFGSWSLAAAAYNMGEEGLRTEILMQKADNYYQLYLPLETQRYVFRAVCAKLILTNPLAYGFDLKAEERYPPLSFDLVTVQSDQNLPIQLIAAGAQTYFKRIKDLNPELRGYFLDEGQHTLMIPPGTAEGFHERFDKLLTNWEAESGKVLYEVQTGDNLSSIAAKFNVPLPALLIWNSRDINRHIHPGELLIIYTSRPENEE